MLLLPGAGGGACDVLDQYGGDRSDWACLVDTPKMPSTSETA